MVYFLVWKKIPDVIFFKQTTVRLSLLYQDSQRGI